MTVWRDRDRLRFVRDAPEAAPVAVGPDGAETLLGRLVRTPLGAVPAAFSASPLSETVDADALDAPLVLRPWQAGDRIAPVGGGRGGGGERRVSDVLTDGRVPPSERAERLVVVAGERVVWLVGHRLAAFAAVTAETRRAERLDWHPAVVGESRTG